MLKRTKKGFTLAELLIVVAILAVLTAIAVPLFVTSLNRAKEATFNANKDVVRTAGMVNILNDTTINLNTLKEGNAFKCVGTFDEDGKFQSVAVSLEDKAGTETTFATFENNQITVYITVKDAKGAITNNIKP